MSFPVKFSPEQLVFSGLFIIVRRSVSKRGAQNELFCPVSPTNEMHLLRTIVSHAGNTSRNCPQLNRTNKIRADSNVSIICLVCVTEYRFSTKQCKFFHKPYISRCYWSHSVLVLADCLF